MRTVEILRHTPPLFLMLVAVVAQVATTHLALRVHRVLQQNTHLQTLMVEAALTDITHRVMLV